MSRRLEPPYSSSIHDQHSSEIHLCAIIVLHQIRYYSITTIHFSSPSTALSLFCILFSFFLLLCFSHCFSLPPLPIHHSVHFHRSFLSFLLFILDLLALFTRVWLEERASRKCWRCWKDVMSGCGHGGNEARSLDWLV